jgi:hypothetical protein
MVEVLQPGEIVDLVGGPAGKVVPLLVGHRQVDELGVEAGVQVGQSGRVADSL